MAELDPKVAAIEQKIELGRKEQATRNARFDRSYDTYRATMPRTFATENWQSKLRVPYARQVIDTALVNIVFGKPRIKVNPRHPEDELAAKAMQVLLDYYTGEDHFIEKQPAFVQQALVYGVSPAKIHWVYRETNGTVIRNGPTFEPWDAYRCFWTPGARSIDDAEYVVLQTWASKNDLLRMQKSDDNPHGPYSNLDALFLSGAAAAPQQTAQQRANRLQAPDVNRYRDKFLIEEIWTDDTVTVIGNRQILLRQDPNPYSHGRKPIVVAQTMPDFFEMLGIPETEAVDHLQQAQWTLQNMVIDNLHLTVQRGITYREGGVTDPNELQLRPRFKWPVSDHDDIRPFEIPPVASDVFEERQRLLADMQLVTGINPYVSGSDLNTVDQNTATGVTALQEVASRLLRFKASMIQNAIQRAYEMWGDMAQQYAPKNKPTWVRIVGAGNESAWAPIKRADIAGHFHYILEGSEESLSRQQERGEAIALLNAFAPLAQLGFINYKPILEKVATAYDFPNPESLFLPPAQPAAPAAPQQPLYNVMQPRIGAAATGQQGAVPEDSQLRSALALLPQR